MWAIVSNNTVDRVIRTPVQITVGGVTYPRNIFTKWTKAALAELGIFPYREVSVNSKYYWQGLVSYEIGDEVVATYAAIDRDVDQLKEGMLSEIKTKAASKLSATDWMVVRAAEGGTSVPAEVSTYRAAVRTRSNELETEVNALTDLTSVIAFDNQEYTEVRKVKHTSEEGVETYGPETEENTRVIRGVDTEWPIDPTAEVDPAFVSLTKNG